MSGVQLAISPLCSCAYTCSPNLSLNADVFVDKMMFPIQIAPVSHLDIFDCYQSTSHSLYIVNDFDELAAEFTAIVDEPINEGLRVSAENKLREYLNGLDVLNGQLSGIRHSFDKLTSYTDLKHVASGGLNDIEALKKQTSDVKDALEYATISEQANSADIVESRQDDAIKHNPHSRDAPKFKHNDAFTHPVLTSEEDVRRLLEALLPMHGGLEMVYFDRGQLCLSLQNAFFALLSLDGSNGWRVTRVNMQSAKERKERKEGKEGNDRDTHTHMQDTRVSEHTLTQHMSVYCTTLVETMQGSLPLTLALLDSYTRTLFTQSCYTCHHLVTASNTIPPYRNIHTEEGWVALHDGCA
ncbi:hypothetical protein E3P99_00755 [Wallemia hederae]|uniref:Uncharacterized protein n=1 Tax=Wallemia hederae TaxID=1540922 RepID=A0A4T0FUW6_9BASI|nr:hypothetical protein E3P99_00755 [Wallemia hederae]